MALAYQNFYFWLLLVVLLFILVGLALINRLKWIPAWFTRVGLVILSLTVIFIPSNLETRVQIDQPRILLLDQSESVLNIERETAWQKGLDWQHEQNNRILLAFGIDTFPVIDDILPSNNNPNGTNLATALNKASSFLGERKGQIILATDGAVPYSQALQESLNLLEKKGQTLDIIPLKSKYTLKDSYVGKIQSPVFVWQGTLFPIILPVHQSQEATDPSFEVTIDGKTEMMSGERVNNNYYSFQIPALQEGIITIGIKAIFKGDEYTENNNAYTTVQAFTAPKMLWISSDVTSSKVLVDGLTQKGINIKLTTPKGLPTADLALNEFKIIVLDNVLSSSLVSEQMTSLDAFVKQSGGGLLFIGGKNAYTLGGYKNTPLEPLFPVKLEPPPRPSRMPILMLLVMDTSGSMGDAIKGASSNTSQIITSLLLAQEAAMRTVETLDMDDYLGVLTFYQYTKWNVEIQKISNGANLRRDQDIISRLSSGGNTYMYEALNEVANYLQNNSSSLPTAKYMLLLSDGKSTDGDAATFKEISQKIYQTYQINISTIALGSDADPVVMAEIANNGKGRYYEVIDAIQLPKIMVSESKAARAENIQSGDTTIKVNIAEHPLLYGLSPAQLPILSSYNALSSKVDEGAEDILVSSSFKDPILSAWQYGLGRVVTWTSTSNMDWIKEWHSADIQFAFWSQILKYTLPNPIINATEVNVKVHNGFLDVSVFMRDKNAIPKISSQVTFAYTNGNAQVVTVQLEQTDIGLFSTHIPSPPLGAYKASVTHLANNGKKIEIPSSFSVNPSVEVLPVDEKQNHIHLGDWVKETHGKILTWENILVTPEETSKEQAPIRSIASEKIFSLLVLVLLWLIDIAIRRRWLPWV